MTTLTEAQARALVPDAAAWLRGQPLATPASWTNLGRDATAAWGECAGSGKDPYQVGLDLASPAFKCTCPSRSLPCKHSVGLLALLASQPALFAAGPAAPPKVADWLTKRHAVGSPSTAPAPASATPAPAATGAAATPAAAGTAAAAKPAKAAPAKPAKASAASLRREAERLALMDQGAAELETWLLDQVRLGLTASVAHPEQWRQAAARLVDNQLPGLAGELRALLPLLPQLATEGPALLAGLGSLYGLLEAFKQRDRLPPAARAEVLQHVGVPVTRAELLAQAAPVADDWLVVGQHETLETPDLRSRRSWLRGQATGRYALVQEYAAGRRSFATPLQAYHRYQGSLAYYPGLHPLRALPLDLQPLAFTPAAPPAIEPGQLLADYAPALAANPWLRYYPATLAGLRPLQGPGGAWGVRFGPGQQVLPLRTADDLDGWAWLARSGGHPLTIFGEWDGHQFLPLGAWPETPAALSAEAVATAIEARPAPIAPSPASLTA